MLEKLINWIKKKIFKDKSEPKPVITNCPYCDAKIEIFTDTSKHKHFYCKECDRIIFADKKPAPKDVSPKPLNSNEENVIWNFRSYKE